MAAKLEFGDAGLELWESLATRQGGLDAQSMTRWRSFGTEATANAVTMDSIFALAHKAGWKGTVRPSVESMFSGVAQLVNTPSLVPQPPPPANGMPTPPPSPKPLRVITAASFAGREPPPREELVCGLIPAKIVGALYADGATGKSLVAGVQLGAAVASANKLWLNRIVQHGPGGLCLRRR